jgi:hypothetical protein
VNKVEARTRPDAAKPATSPWESIATEPAAAALTLVEANAASMALSLMPEGVVPSVNEAPHSDCKAGAASEAMLGAFLAIIVYAAFIQFEQVMFVGRVGGLSTMARMFVIVRGPKMASMLVRVSVMQFVLPSFKQTTCRTVG